MEPTSDIRNRLPEINALEAQALQAAQAGRDDEAQRLWGRILELDPNHVRTLSRAGPARVPCGGHAVGPRSVPAHRRRRRLGSAAMDPSRPRLPQPEGRAGRGERDPAGADPRPQRAGQPHPPRQPARAARQDARGGRRLQRGGRRGAADRPPASRASSGGRRGERAGREIQRIAGHSSTSTSTRTSGRSRART